MFRTIPPGPYISLWKPQEMPLLALLQCDSLCSVPSDRGFPRRSSWFACFWAAWFAVVVNCGSGSVARKLRATAQVALCLEQFLSSFAPPAPSVVSANCNLLSCRLCNLQPTLPCHLCNLQTALFCHLCDLTNYSFPSSLQLTLFCHLCNFQLHTRYQKFVFYCNWSSLIHRFSAIISTRQPALSPAIISTSSPLHQQSSPTIHYLF